MRLGRPCVSSCTLVWLSAALVLTPVLVSKSQPASSAECRSSATSAPSIGKATIYVYRKGSMVGAIALPSIFVNGDRLAELHNSNYALARVPVGMAAVAATQIPEGDFLDSRGNRFRLPGPKSNVSTLPGCEGLDFVRMWVLGDYSAVQRVDSKRCGDSLRAARARISVDLGSPGPSEEVINLCSLGFSRAGSAGRMSWTSGYDRGDVASCGRAIDGAIVMLNTTSQPVSTPTRISIDVESGKTYYIRWSVSSRGERSSSWMRRLEPKTSASFILRTKGEHNNKSRCRFDG
jgi:hypothetical protein